MENGSIKYPSQHKAISELKLKIKQTETLRCLYIYEQISLYILDDKENTPFFWTYKPSYLDLPKIVILKHCWWDQFLSLKFSCKLILV